MRERIIDLARGAQFIPHVYDYCDHWCRYCPVQARCLVYRVEQIRRSDASRRWPRRTVGDEVRDSLEFMTSVWEATGTPVARLDAVLADPVKAPREPALGDPLELLARHYAIVSGGFLRALGVTFWEEPDGPVQTPHTVLACYHILIAAKTYRALVGAQQSCGGGRALEDDSNGSAKIALLGIDRSITALHEIGETDDDARIDALIELLEALRSSVEHRFPGARMFLRPGLDTPAEGQQQPCG